MSFEDYLPYLYERDRIKFENRKSEASPILRPYYEFPSLEQWKKDHGYNYN